MKPYYERDNVTVYNGDCLHAIAQMRANSIDTIITDPPYGLTDRVPNVKKCTACNRVLGGADGNPSACPRCDGVLERQRTPGKKGFMGKTWDHGVPGVEYWVEALRVAKPGAIMLAFGGTRTHHRLMCAIEDAGWEIRDVIMWVYGCLSEDTEMLTNEGFKPYHRTTLQDTVLCYNIDSDKFNWESPEDVIIYDYEDTAYRIKSDFTDQIVSKNHRCIVERGGREVFRYAETLERQESIPILEDLPELLKTLSDNKSCAGKAEQTLSRVRDIEPKDEQEKETARSKGNDVSNLSHLREGISQAELMGKENETSLLQLPMQWHSTWRGVEKTRSQREGCLERRDSRGLQNISNRGKQSSMEGWRYLSQPSRELCQSNCKVREMPLGIYGHGQKRRVRYGASSNCGSSYRTAVDKERSGTSHKSQRGRQQPRKSNAIQKQQRSQDVRASRFTRSDLATVTPIQYKGIMWCVKVPSGAFVARRNGKVFITGNSGFPKSLDIGKAIDKSNGAVREVVGRYIVPADSDAGNAGKVLTGYAGSTKVNTYSDRNGPSENGHPITAPSTPLAKTFDGYGTALKPAFEIIIVAQKKIDQNYAHNAEKWGVAGLNIDGSRIETEVLESEKRFSNSGKISERVNFGTTSYREPQHGEWGRHNPKGRFPSNLIHDGSPEVMREFERVGVTTSGNLTGQPRSENNIYGSASKTLGTPRYYNGDSGLPSRYFKECPPDSDPTRFRYCPKASSKDRGNGNNHPTVKPQSLLRYLCRLTKTPYGGVILDLFAGSGSTGLAARTEGRPCILIEKEPEYCEIIVNRLNNEADVSPVSKRVEQPEPTQTQLALF